jgi:anti-sigma factor RsiW
MFMKTFEERYTAWIDGKLSGPELSEFAVELREHPDAESDKQAARQVGALLRQHASVSLSNVDFFNNQLMARIERDASASPAQPKQANPWFPWPWARLVFAGAAAVALGWFVSRVTNPGIQSLPSKGPVQQASYLAQIIDAKPAEPDISATVVHDDQDNVTVLWLDGLEYLPASYELQ